jgi:hypothetical protein
VRVLRVRQIVLHKLFASTYRSGGSNGNVVFAAACDENSRGRLSASFRIIDRLASLRLGVAMPALVLAAQVGPVMLAHIGQCRRSIVALSASLTRRARNRIGANGSRLGISNGSFARPSDTPAGQRISLSRRRCLDPAAAFVADRDYFTLRV